MVGAVSAGFFKLFLDRHLEKFKITQAESLAKLQAEQAEQLEKVRFRLGILSGRLAGAFEKEREILNETWAKLMEAKGATREIASSFRWYPILDRMPSDELSDFILRLDIPD